VTVAVGADADRVAWAVRQVRAGAEAAGRERPPPIGAYVNVVCHPDVDTAYSLGQGRLAAHARFAVLHGAPAGPVHPDDRETLLRLRGRYDMRDHGRPDADHAQEMSLEFARRFAVLGPAPYCVERLSALRAVGVDHFVVGGPSFGVDKREAAMAMERMSFEVLPALR
jgi:alkanesulfonate monooxygenase SsuD/methylene tetrahydromethanopterin reductase-like flavin-dependent oxidoreductase (luciferase family)